jgi:peptidoglycan/LPS O-acetylase OafA/YrhL
MIATPPAIDDMSPVPPNGHRRNGEVDALRCFAMLAVVAMHSGLLPFGWTGVWMFYVISGFVVTAALARHPDATPVTWLTRFYARRAARIIPVYAIYVVTVAVIAWFATGVPSLAAVSSLLFFYNNFAMILGFGEIVSLPVGHLWTISVEMQFYLVYGPLFVFLPPKVLFKVLWAFVLLSPIARALAGHWAPHVLGSELAAAYAIYATSFLHFDSFGAGALLALSWSTLAGSRNGAIKLFVGGTALLVLYMIAYAGVNTLVLGRQGIDAVKDIISGILHGQGREIWLYSALMAFNVGVVAWTATGRAPWRTVTQVRSLQWIGEISYGAYVFHALMIHLVKTIVMQVAGPDISFFWRFVVFVLSSVLAIAAAAVSARFIERPSVRWMNRRLDKRPIPNGVMASTE